MTDHWNASVQATCDPIVSSILLVIAQNKHEWKSEGILFQPWKDGIFFNFKSTGIHLLSCLVCLSDKMADFIMIYQIACQSISWRWVNYNKLGLRLSSFIKDAKAPNKYRKMAQFTMIIFNIWNSAINFYVFSGINFWNVLQFIVQITQKTFGFVANIVHFPHAGSFSFI